MLTGTNLSKSYNAQVVLENVNIEIVVGKIHGLLGKNGAGKSTLFKILCNLVTPDSGSVQIASTQAKPIGAIIEKTGIYPYLNAATNLKIFARIQKAPTTKEVIEKSLTRVGLPLNRKDAVKNFSMGMKQRLAIAIALLNNPKCLILDEPFSGLDPLGVASLIAYLKDLAQKENMAILVSSHLISELNKCCDYLYVINEGKIIKSGNTKKLIDLYTTHYIITASTKITLSSPTTFESILLDETTVKITCSSSQIASLLKELIDSGNSIISCVPEFSLEQLLLNPNQA